MTSLENIKIFLTDQARGRPAGRVADLSGVEYVSSSHLVSVGTEDGKIFR